MKKFDRQKVFENLVLGSFLFSFFASLMGWIYLINSFVSAESTSRGPERAVEILVSIFSATVLAFIGFVALFMLLGSLCMQISCPRRKRLKTKELNEQLDHSWMEHYQFSGYRTAYLMSDGESVRFRSITYHSTFGPEESAKCAQAKGPIGHRAPNKNCTCGFYSVDKPSGTLSQSGGEVLLRCFYTGTVIPGSKGARAHRQHVISVLIPGHCSVARKCNEPATHVTMESSIRTTAEGTWRQLVSCCDHHSTFFTSFSEVDLRNLLQVDIEWIR